MTTSKETALEVRLRVDRSSMRLVGVDFDGTAYEIAPKSTVEVAPDTLKYHHLHNHSHQPQMQPSEAASNEHDITSRALLIRQLIFGVSTLLFLVLSQAGLAKLLLSDQRELIRAFAPWSLYLDLTVVSLVATIGYLRMYRYAQTNHMTGMMIGMTVGMQVGMMTGGVIGATDGYFLGAMVGVGLGTLLGLTTSWCCGPMAITQSLMSAVMGGTMGAMIVSMMPPDQLNLFMPLFTFLNLAILVWFTRLFFKDCVIGEHCTLLKPMSLGAMLGTSVSAVAILSGLMLLNPRIHSVVQKEVMGNFNPFKSNELRAETLKDPQNSGEMSCGASMKGQ